MYDELERAAGVRPRSGLSVLGWIGVGVVTLGLLGVAGSFLAYRFVRHQVDEVVSQFEHLEIAPFGGGDALVARTVARTLDELGVAPAALDDEALSAAVSRALTARSQPSDPADRRTPRGERVDGILRIQTDEGEFTADLHAGEEGGSLVVRRPDGRVVVDLSADEQSGRLVVGADGEIVRIEAGPGAVALPRWLPAPDDRPRDLRRVVSGHAGEAAFGAVTWSSTADPESIVDDWRSRLEADGWTVRAEHRLDTEFDGRSASVVAHHPDADRVAILAVGRDDGATRVVMGWGEGLDAGG